MGNDFENGCIKCGHEEVEHLSDGGGAEMWRCVYCGAVYNVNPFGVSYLFEWENYACKHMFPPPKGSA